MWVGSCLIQPDDLEAFRRAATYVRQNTKKAQSLPISPSSSLTKSSW